MNDKPQFKDISAFCPVCGRSEIMLKGMVHEEYSIFECLMCRFLFVNPMPSDTFLSKYYDEVFDHIGIIAPLRMLETRKIIRWILRERKVRDSSSLRFYEIGIGKGSFLDEVAKQKVMVSGCELSKDMVQEHAQKYPIDYGRFEDFNYRDQFDIVYSSHVLEHTNDPAGLVGAIHKSLKGGGLAVVRVPNRHASSAILACMLLGREKWNELVCAPSHLMSFGKTSLKTLFEQHEFRIVRIQTLPVIVSLLDKYLEVFAKWIIYYVLPIIGVKRNPRDYVKPVLAGGKTYTSRIDVCRRWLHYILFPFDRLFMWVTWPLFRLLDLGAEWIIILEKKESRPPQ